MTIKITKHGNPAKSMALAIEHGDTEEMQVAWDETMQAIAESVRSDYEALAVCSDRNALAQRGIRQLTTAEERFYSALEGACRAGSAVEARQAFVDIIGDDKDDDLMPVTIIEDVFKELEDEHELLQVIKFNYVGYATKWLRNNNTAQKAVWGKITGEIIKEISSDLDVIRVDQNKLSAFCVIPLDILDMGHSFMDAYVRRVLKEALSCGLESGIISGNGIDCPYGLDRDVDPANFNGSTGAPQKEAVKCTSFAKDNYLPLVAELAKTENGKARKFDEVCLLVNTFDYLSKVAPASTMLTPQGTYANNIFPFPTHVIQSTEVESGTAIMFVPDAYTFCVGGARNNLIEFSDEFKFLEDARTFKIVTHGDGQADDNTATLVLDISELEPLMVEVRIGDTVTTSSASTESESTPSA